MPELIPINIVVADRTYRIKADPKDEQSIRSTVKFLNDKLMEFKTAFAGKDMQDYLAMAVIWYATQQTGGRDSAVDRSLNADLEKIRTQLTDTLNELK